MEIYSLTINNIHGTYMTYINIALTGTQVTRANFPASIDAQPQCALTGAHGTIFSFAANALKQLNFQKCKEKLKLRFGWVSQR